MWQWQQEQAGAGLIICLLLLDTGTFSLLEFLSVEVATSASDLKSYP